MTMKRGDFTPLTDLAGEQSFTVFCFGTQDTLAEVSKPGYFQMQSSLVHDGDFLVTHHVPAKTFENPYPRGRKAVWMIHKDHRKQVSLTRLFELPHEPGALHEVLESGLLPTAEPRYVPSFLEDQEQRQAAQAAEREAADAAAAERPARSKSETNARTRDRLHLKRV